MQAEEISSRSTGGEGVGDGACRVFRVTADLRPVICDTEIGGILDGVGEAAGVQTLGEAQEGAVEAADIGFGHRRILTGDGVFHEVADAVVVGIVIRALLERRNRTIDEGLGDPR